MEDEAKKHTLCIIVDAELHDALLLYSLSRGHAVLSKGIRELLQRGVGDDARKEKFLIDVAEKIKLTYSKMRKNKKGFLQTAPQNMGFIQAKTIKALQSLLEEEERAENEEESGRANREPRRARTK